MNLKKIFLPVLLAIGMMIGFAGCGDGTSSESIPEPVVETVTDKVYDGFGTFTGTTVDGKPTEGKLVTDEYTYEGTFEDGFKLTGTGKLTYKGEDAGWSEGTFVNGLMDGYGQVYYTGGYHGIGQWKNGKLQLLFSQRMLLRQSCKILLSNRVQVLWSWFQPGRVHRWESET